MAKRTRPNEVFKLEPNVEDPRYEGFGFDSRASVRGKSCLAFDFMPDDIPTKGRAWTMPRMAHLWTPQSVSGRVRPYNDYPCCNLSIPAFSERAVEALRDMLEPNGELLPLVSPIGTYFAYNITTVADVLDIEQSEIDWYDDKSITLPSSVVRHEFRPDKLDGLSIFRLVEEPARTYVTNLFVERVRAHHLRGFVFRKLWPLTSQEDYPEDDAGDEDVTAQSVIVQLALAKAKPNKAEKMLVEGLMDQIDLWLLAAECEENYLGSLEGNEYVSKECRIFLSSPDADTLASWLTPRLQTITWHGTVSLTTRVGPYDTFGSNDCLEACKVIR